MSRDDKRSIDRFVELYGSVMVNAVLSDYFTGKLVPKELVKENEFLHSVSVSEVFEHYGKPFTSGRDLWDFLTTHYNFTPKT